MVKLGTNGPLNWNLTFEGATPQDVQTHSKNLLARADELLQCAWPFCGIGP